MQTLTRLHCTTREAGLRRMVEDYVDGHLRSSKLQIMSYKYLLFAVVWKLNLGFGFRFTLLFRCQHSPHLGRGLQRLSNKIFFCVALLHPFLFS